MNSLNLFKGLADESRLKIVGLLRQKPYCVEDLAEQLQLAVSTVSVHLKKLQQAGLVYNVKVQYYSVFHLKSEMLAQTLESLIPDAHLKVNDPTEALRAKVLKTYFRDGRLDRLPTQNKKRWICYLEIIKLFSPGISYTEKELNELIKTVYEDYCMVRRELVDEGVLRRENGIYRFVENYAEHPGFYQKIWAMSEEKQG